MRPLRKFKWRIGPTNAVLYAGLTGLAAFMLLPIVFIINHAFKPLHELFLFPPTFLVRQPTLRNFELLFMSTSSDFVPFSRYLLNSIIVVVITVISVVIISSMAAYALSKRQFPFKAAIMSIIMVALMFAAETVAIPRYLIVSGLGITDTYFALVLPLLASPVAVFLLIQFMGQIPNELIEAAKLDGATEIGVFRKVVMPLSMPAIVTVAIITFQASWTDGEASTLFIQDETMKTLPYYVSTLLSGLSNTVVGQNIVAAAGLLMFLPILLVFILFQSKVNETMVHTGVK